MTHFLSLVTAQPGEGQGQQRQPEQAATTAIFTILTGLVVDRRIVDHIVGRCVALIVRHGGRQLDGNHGRVGTQVQIALAVIAIGGGPVTGPIAIVFCLLVLAFDIR